MLFIILSYALLECAFFIKNYITKDILIEEELVGLEIEYVDNNKINKIDDIIYSPLKSSKYNNTKYIGNKYNISNMYLFDKNNLNSFNNAIKIINSYKYSENILKIINSYDKKLILNEISIKNAYIININNKYIYDNNIYNIILYYAYNCSCIVNLIKYFLSTNFWT
jgi:hypothetical protein